jgi:hypothetical protein
VVQEKWLRVSILRQLSQGEKQMSHEQLLESIRQEIRDLGNTIQSPLSSDREKQWAAQRLEVIRKQLEELNNQVKEVK